MTRVCELCIFRASTKPIVTEVHAKKIASLPIYNCPIKKAQGLKDLICPEHLKVIKSHPTERTFKDVYSFVQHQAGTDARGKPTWRIVILDHAYLSFARTPQYGMRKKLHEHGFDFDALRVTAIDLRDCAYVYCASSIVRKEWSLELRDVVKGL